MPAEQEGAREDPLTMLGDVPEPDPAALAAARERLWSAVAGEMLPLGPDEIAAEPGERRSSQPRARTEHRRPPFRRGTSGERP